MDAEVLALTDALVEADVLADTDALVEAEVLADTDALVEADVEADVNAERLDARSFTTLFAGIVSVDLSG